MSLVNCSPSKHVGLILARGGSKGIPHKNIRPISGIPLIAWVLRAAIAFKKLEKVWVSTDDPLIAEVSQEFGAEIHWRSKASATDSSSSLEAVAEFLQNHPDVEILVLLQCTSPCLQPAYLEKGYNLILEKKYDSVFAVTRHHKLQWKEIKDGKSTKPVNFDPFHRPRRQDWSGELVETGMFYITRSHFVLNQGTLQGGTCGYVEIAQEHSLDIDSPFDWLIAENIVPKFGYLGEGKSERDSEQHRRID